MIFQVRLLIYCLQLFCVYRKGILDALIIESSKAKCSWTVLKLLQINLLIKTLQNYSLNQFKTTGYPHISVCVAIVILKYMYQIYRLLHLSWYIAKYVYKWNHGLINSNWFKADLVKNYCLFLTGMYEWFLLCILTVQNQWHFNFLRQLAPGLLHGFSVRRYEEMREPFDLFAAKF